MFLWKDWARFVKYGWLVSKGLFKCFLLQLICLSCRNFINLAFHNLHVLGQFVSLFYTVVLVYWLMFNLFLHNRHLSRFHFLSLFPVPFPPQSEKVGLIFVFDTKVL